MSWKFTALVFASWAAIALVTVPQPISILAVVPWMFVSSGAALLIAIVAYLLGLK